MISTTPLANIAATLPPYQLRYGYLLYIVSSRRLTAVFSTFIGVLEMIAIVFLIILAIRLQAVLLDTCAARYAMSLACTIPSMSPGLLFVPGIFAFCLSPLYVVYVSAPLLVIRDVDRWPHSPLYSVEITAMQRAVLEWLARRVRGHYIGRARFAVQMLLKTKRRGHGADASGVLPIEIQNMILACIEYDIEMRLQPYFQRLRVDVGDANKRRARSHDSVVSGAATAAATATTPTANAAGPANNAAHPIILAPLEIQTITFHSTNGTVSTHVHTNINHATNAAEMETTNNGNANTDDTDEEEGRLEPHDAIWIWLTDLALFMGFTQDPFGIRSHILFLIESPFSDCKDTLIFFAVFSRDLAIIMLSVMFRVCIIMLLSRHRLLVARSST